MEMFLCKATPISSLQCLDSSTMSGLSGTVDSIFSQLEDEVTCSICLQVFTHPCILDCMHTYCRSCLIRLMNAAAPGVIFTCPTCRAPMPTYRTDFKSQRFTELYLELQKKRTVSLCQLCETLHSEKYCSTCNKVLCSVCTKTHLKLTKCLETATRDLPQYTDQLKEMIHRKLADLENKKREVDNKVQNQHLEYRTMTDSILTDLDQAEEELHKSVAEHFSRHRQELNSVGERCVTKVNEQVGTFTKNMNDYRDQLVQATKDPVELVTKYKDIEKRVSRAGRKFEGSAPYKLPNLRMRPSNTKTNMQAFDASKALWVTCEVLDQTKTVPKVEILIDD